MLRWLLLMMAMPGLVAAAPVRPPGAGAGHYLFVFSGDQAGKGKDFLAVIDADPASPGYGRLLTSVATDQTSVRPHHTEYEMPASGMLFANDHDANRSFIFDLRDPLHPRVATSFTDMAGFSMPHSFLRLPNGHVLASFQHAGPGMAKAGMAGMMGHAKHGGLVEIDDAGKVVRAVANADPAFSIALMMPYSLAVLPDIDRVLSTNSSMHDEDIGGTTIQLWRLSDLTLLKTAYLDAGAEKYAHLNPEEVRIGPDGAAYIQTLACGIERITGMASDRLDSKLVHVFPGNYCGVPTIVGHYLIQSVEAVKGFVVLDIADGANPREVSRLTISPTFRPHWTGWDAKTGRIVATATEPGDRTYLLKFDPKTGSLTIDQTFRGIDGKPGFRFAKRAWPHGWTGAGKPHGAVFSR